MKEKFKLAICQMQVCDSKEANIDKALSMLDTAAQMGANIAVLPEMFNCPYENSKFSIYAENEKDSPTLKSISAAAREKGIYVVAGSIPEIDNGSIYNTCFVFDRKGNTIGKHRKVHLFDIDIEGEICFRESDILSAGEEITVIDTEFCRIGIAICFDIRFPELMRLMSLKGAEVIIIPGAFNMVTGPAHWESLIRIRAVDNQVYVAAASPARNMEASYIAYGNSMIVEPWGNILGRAGEGEEIIVTEIDLARVEKVRKELPLLNNRRLDVYELTEKNNPAAYKKINFNIKHT